MTIDLVDAQGRTKTESGLVTPEGEPASRTPEFSEATLRYLPQPQGYRILVAIPEAEDLTEGGLYKPEAAKRLEEVATVVGFVLIMGPDCYKDEKRFPSGPWCKEGDFVVFRAFSGTRINVRGKEFRIINDDTVEAVVDDPRGITRAG